MGLNELAAATPDTKVDPEAKKTYFMASPSATAEGLVGMNAIE